MRTSERWVRPGWAAGRLGISREALARLVDRGVLPVFRIPGGMRRYVAEDVERLRETAYRPASSSRNPRKPARRAA